MKGIIVVIVLTATALLAACDKNDRSFSLLGGSQIFQQSSSTVNNKIDIIWMVDGSGTMENHQANLGNNFNAFISDFVGKGFDYHMVVASTDAWLREVNYNGGTCTSNPNPSQNPNTMYTSSADCDPTLATFGQLTRFRDGDIYGTQSGNPGARSGTYLLTSLMNPATMLSTFSTNVRTGIRGDGSREAGFQSLRSVLRRNENGSVGYGGETHTVLSTFRRSDAFLAVILISDEEDQSRRQNNTTYASTTDYVNGFVTFMDGYTGGVPGNRRYNVNSITITDINNCAYGLHAQATQGDRYVAIAQATNGVLGSICSTDFSSQLNDISEQIITLSSRFQLNREPIPASIVVQVNGAIVPQSAVNGWTYITDSGFYYIEFHGAAIPPQGATIAVDFDPVAPM